MAQTRQQDHRVTLTGGPAAGRCVLAADPWVWVTVVKDDLHVYDLDHPASGQGVHPPWWEVYEDDGDHRTYRYAGRTPRTT